MCEKQPLFIVKIQKTYIIKLKYPNYLQKQNIAEKYHIFKNVNIEKIPETEIIFYINESILKVNAH